MLEDIIAITEDIHIDVPRRTLTVLRPITGEHLVSCLKRVWFMYPSTMRVEFPLSTYIVNGNVVVELCANWSFADVDSYNNVSPRVVWNEPVRPEPPLAPMTTVVHPSRPFQQGTSLEALIDALPRGTNLKSTRVTSGFDGKIYLSVPGTWPNPDLRREHETHEVQMRAYGAELDVYEAATRVWHVAVGDD